MTHILPVTSSHWQGLSVRTYISKASLYRTLNTSTQAQRSLMCAHVRDVVRRRWRVMYATLYSPHNDGCLLKQTSGLKG